MELLITYAPPAVLATAFVWLASAVSWMVLPHHANEYRGFDDEPALRKALADQKLPPGQYYMPRLQHWEQASTPEGRARYEEGPVVFLTVLANRVPSISRHMLLTLAHYLLVNAGIVAAVAFLAPPDAVYRQVFPPAAVIGLLAHGSAVIPEAIWYGKPWGNVLRSLVDAMLFALLGAGAIAGVWPAS